MEKQQSQTAAQESSTVPAKQPDPERERKRAWLNRYRESLAEQRRIAERLAEVRSCSTSICVSLNPAKAAPTNAHSDHVADSVQRIAALEKKLQEEQCRGQDIAAEIINALYDQRQLTLNQIRVLCCQYIDGLTVPKTADKIGLSSDTVKNYRIKALVAFVVPEPVEVCEHEA